MAGLPWDHSPSFSDSPSLMGLRARAAPPDAESATGSTCSAPIGYIDEDLAKEEGAGRLDGSHPTKRSKKLSLTEASAQGSAAALVLAAAIGGWCRGAPGAAGLVAGCVVRPAASDARSSAGPDMVLVDAGSTFARCRSSDGAGTDSEPHDDIFLRYTDGVEYHPLLTSRVRFFFAFTTPRVHQ